MLKWPTIGNLIVRSASSYKAYSQAQLELRFGLSIQKLK